MLLEDLAPTSHAPWGASGRGAAMTKPDVLELIDVHAGTTARLDHDYALHRLWAAGDRDRLVAEVAPRVRAAVTNGIVGMKGDLIEALPALEIIGVLRGRRRRGRSGESQGQGRARDQHAGRADRGRRRAGARAAAGGRPRASPSTTGTCAPAAGRRKGTRRSRARSPAAASASSASAGSVAGSRPWPRRSGWRSVTAAPRKPEVAWRYYDDLVEMARESTA